MQVEIVTEIRPGSHKEEEEGADEGVGGAEIVECLGEREEEVRDVVRDVDRETDVCEMEAVGESNEGERDEMVHDEFFIVLAGLLEPEEEDYHLLSPESGLEEIVELELGLVRLVGVFLVEGARVEVPDGRLVHDIETKGAHEGDVEGRVGLLEETADLALLLEAADVGKWAEDLFHDEFAGEGEDDGEEGDEEHILETFAVDSLGGVVLAWLGVGELNEGLDGVIRVWVLCV